MRMDIENSPGAGRGPDGPAARNNMGQRFGGGGAMCGNCLYCLLLRDHCRERRMAKLETEHGVGVLWHHAASTLKTADPKGRGECPSKE
jgi:hypothetical protein